MYEIIICSNNETICDGYTDDRTAAWQDEIAASYVGAAAEVICDAAADGKDVDHDTERFFAHWHGGKHAKVGAKIGDKTYGYSAGWVVCHSVDPPQWVKDLCDKAAQAGADARDEAVADYERQAGSEVENETSN